MSTFTFLLPNLSFGGIQTQVFYLATFLKEKYGAEVRVVGFVNKDSEFISLLDQQNIPWSFRPDLGGGIWDYESSGRLTRIKVWLKLWLLLLSQGKTVVFPYTKNLDTFVNALVSFTFVKKTFSFERGGHIILKRQPDSLINRLRKKSNPIYVANSLHGKEAISFIKGVDKDEIHVIPNGIDTSRFSLKKRIASEKIVFLMVANFFPEKEHLFLIESWSKLDQETKNKTLLKFVGLGAGEVCKNNFEQAKRKVSELNLTCYISFAGASSDVLSELNEADVGILATRSEGCPNAILEYMAVGLPILASDIPGVREVISDDNRGLLFQNSDSTDFLDKLHKVVEDADLRLNLSRINREFVENRFSINQMRQAYSNLLEEHKLI